MATKDNPSIGYGKCGSCRVGRASIHQQQGGSPFLYSRFCENDSCNKKTCQVKRDDVQQFLWDNLEPIKGVVVKEPPVVYRAKNNGSEKTMKPSDHQGCEWSPEPEVVVGQVVEKESETSDEPSGGKGLLFGLLVLATGVAVAMRGGLQ